MKILFVCLGNVFTETMLYKENYLIKAAVQDGHSVMVIASTDKYDGNRIVSVGEGESTIFGKAQLIRLSYDRIINEFISSKFRRCSKLQDYIHLYRPDAISFQCIQVFNIIDCRWIKSILPRVKIYADVSTARYNSGTKFLSYHILHKMIYRNWIKKAEAYLDKVFYVAPECKDFLTQVYGMNESKLEFNPLPCEVTTYEKKKQNRKLVEQRYNLNENDIIFSHTGKMDKLKLTIELLEQFLMTKSKDFKLLIGGAFSSDIEADAIKLIEKDQRIQYIGFLNAQELTELLCATDLYLQPGSPSQTAQTAIGCFAPIVFPNVSTYQPFFNGNGYMIKSVTELHNIFEEVAKNPGILKQMSENSKKVAEELLDYRKLAARLYE